MFFLLLGVTGNWTLAHWGFMCAQTRPATIPTVLQSLHPRVRSRLVAPRSEGSRPCVPVRRGPRAEEESCQASSVATRPLSWPHFSVSDWLSLLYVYILVEIVFMVETIFRINERIDFPFFYMYSRWFDLDWEKILLSFFIWIVWIFQNSFWYIVEFQISFWNSKFFNDFADVTLAHDDC